MRSQYEDSFAAIPYHARENSLPFSYGQIKPNSTATLMTRRNNDSYETMIGSGVYNNKTKTVINDDLDFDLKALKINENNEKLNNIHNNNNSNEATNGLIKPQTRLTSPLLVRKTLNNPNSKTTPTTTINTIANTYPYKYNNNNKENKLYRDEFDSGYKNETLSHNVPYVTLNGTLDKHYYNNNYNKSLRCTTPTPRNYEEFEELLRERRQKVINEHGISNSTYLEPAAVKLKNNTAAKAQKYNYDFEFNLLNLIDRKNDSGFGEPPAPPSRHYTLDRVQLSPRVSVERNYHTINATTKTSSENNWQALPPASTLIPTQTSAERPPLELDVGYKRHFEMLQQQREQWPGYNTNSKYNNHSSIVTTYGNGNMTGYHNTNNNLGKNHGWQEADIQRQFDAAPIYATTTKKQQHAQTTVPDKINAGKVFYDETDFYRPETPSFPVTPRTPSLAPTLQRETNCQGLTRSNMNLTETQEVAAHLVKFAKDSSQFWYKPNLSREEAIALLINATPGTFLVRDSTTYKNAYGLVLRVSQPPPGALATGKAEDLVRHFLIEPTTRGVRLKGCANEPVFTSLSALVYEHSINQLALPCLLHIPDHDLLPPRTEPTPAQRQLLTQGAACNVLLLFSAETESLTGEEAIRKAIRQMYVQKPLPAPIEVHFKVSQQGITLTDNTRKRFFRKHYGTDSISYCAIDPDNRLWTMQDESQSKKTIFAFVARRSPSSKDNQCHIFCDLTSNQPASAIVSFVNKTLPTEHQRFVKL